MRRGRWRRGIDKLVAMCSFGEFCAAYEASRLVALFDAKGLWGGRQGILYLDEMLAGTPSVNKSVLGPEAVCRG